MDVNAGREIAIEMHRLVRRLTDLRLPLTAKRVQDAIEKIGWEMADHLEKEEQKQCTTSK